MNEQEFKTKLRDIATNAVRQSIKLRLSNSAVLDIGRRSHKPISLLKYIC
jgi:hypothetical protein